MLESSSPSHLAYRRLCDPRVADLPWLDCDGAVISFGQLRNYIDRVAALIARRSIAHGDRVLIATRDDSHAAQLFVALICSGITAVNVDADAGPQRAQGILRKAKPALIVADQEVIERWQLNAERVQIVAIAPAPRKRSLFSFAKSQTVAATGWASQLAEATPREPVPGCDDENIAYIMFTSGTTDEPKGVCISHRALFAHLSTLVRRFGYGRDSRIMNTLMLAHADGMIQGPVIGFYALIPVLRPLKFEISNLDRWLDAIYRYRVTHLVAVPTLLALMHRLGIAQQDTFQGGDFKLLIACGAQLEAALWQQIERTFRVPLVNVYGLTETVVGGVFSGPDELSRMPGSIGMPEDCELRITDEAGRPRAVGAEGELQMRGDLLMSGYFESPGATALVMEDGWLKTGDMARCDAAGRYWITGRIKNIIIRGGYNIHPEEVTEALQRHPGIREAVTVAIPDLIWGEIVASLLVADPGLTERDVNHHCMQHLEPRKIPSRIIFVEALPRGVSGKVQLDLARELAVRHMTPTVEAISTEQLAPRLLRVAAACFRAQLSELELGDTPEDIAGWDSLSHLEFVSAVEREFGVRLSTQDILSIDRLGTILQLIGTS